MNKSILQIALASTLLAGVAQAAPFQNGSFEIGPAPGATFITLGCQPKIEMSPFSPNRDVPLRRSSR